MRPEPGLIQIKIKRNPSCHADVITAPHSQSRVVRWFCGLCVWRRIEDLNDRLVLLHETIEHTPNTISVRVEKLGEHCNTTHQGALSTRRHTTSHYTNTTPCQTWE